ncbi:MAG: aldo/keto reductase [Rubrivivax sp.]|nr:aldo/keto reductase [Rubrivivax sp.]
MPACRRLEVRALRAALDIGYRVFDTAEMYGDGGAEQVLGEALQASWRAGELAREDIFIITKVYPHNAGTRAMRKACEASLRRLGVEQVDLYLLHWRGDVPLDETIAAFGELVQRGCIARWGVSNFDVADMRELEALPGGRACAANQVYLSVSERGAEYELLPWQQARSMPLMAYSPIDQGALAGNEALARVAARHGATAAQVALAALFAMPGVMAIPKSANEQRLRENWAAAQLQLTNEDLADLDRAFPRPSGKKPLAMI